MKRIFEHDTSLPELASLNTVEMNSRRYYLTPDGKSYPSITTVLGHFKRASLASWRARVGEEEANRISSRAATRGTKFHALIEKHLRNETNFLTEGDGIMPDLVQAVRDMMSVLERVGKIHYIESALYSHDLRVAGRTDLIAEFDGVPSIIDFKTSSRPKSESYIQDYFLQGAAYALMYEERVQRPIEQIVILISPNDGNAPQVFINNKSDHIDPLMCKIAQFHKEFS